MSSECLVTFDNNPDGVYYSGQTVSGDIQLTTTKSKDIRGVHITVIGFAEVRFSDDKDSEQHDATDDHKDLLGADEQYLFVRNYVEGERNGKSFTFPAGTKSYRFEAQLPSICPTSFDGEFGHIRYEVIVTIDRAWRYNNIYKQPFTVIHDLDLNLLPHLKTPVTISEYKKMLGGFCIRTLLRIAVTLPHSGYVPGQLLTAHIFVQNYSFSNCTALKVKFQRIARYRSTFPKAKIKEMKFAIREGHFGSIPKFRRKHILATIPILAVTPTTLGTCTLMDVSYFLKIKASVAGWHKSMKLTIPITVGTIPFKQKESANRNQQPNGCDSGTEMIAGVNEINDSGRKYKEMESFLPNFDTNYDETSGIKNARYLPKYPYFEDKTMTMPFMQKTRQRLL